MRRCKPVQRLKRNLRVKTMPDAAGLNPLPPAVDLKEAKIVLELNIDAKSRVQDLERIGDNEDHNKQGKQLMYRLRETTFRARFADGQPQETEKMVTAFDVQ